MVPTHSHTCTNIPHTPQEKEGFASGAYALSEEWAKITCYLTGLPKCSKCHKRDRSKCHRKVWPQQAREHLAGLDNAMGSTYCTTLYIPREIENGVGDGLIVTVEE